MGLDHIVITGRAKEMDVLPNSITALVQQPWKPKAVTGLELLCELKEALRVLPTGSSLIDGLLDQGVMEGTIAEVVGESSTGKSQLCMLFAATTALRGEGVVYLDTAAAFSPVRVLGLCRALKALDPESGPEDAERAVSQAMACIQVLKPHSATAALACLDKVSLQLHARQRRRGRPPALQTRVLIVDSISAIITPILGGMQHSQGHTLMMSLSRMLKQLMQQFRLSVMVTNHVVSAGGGTGPTPAPAAAGSGSGPPPLQHRPALGEHWRNQAHCRLMLAMEDDGARSATLMSSTSPMPSCIKSVEAAAAAAAAAARMATADTDVRC
ncbi:MAG: hypothetical protein WDW36_004804 [Sanguina aurantia]